jgi:hypothetical protein
MASNPFNALLYDPAQLGQGVQNAFWQGREWHRQMETQQALGAYASDQSAENAAKVTQHDPRLGLQLQDREEARARAQQEAEAEAYKRDLQGRAAQGDKAALAELAGIDLNAWDKLADNDKAMIAERVKFVGDAALAVSQLDPSQQAQAWDQYAMYGAQRFPELAEQVGEFSPEALQGALAMAGQVKTFLDMEKPSYMAIPQGGTLVNTRDPQAVAQFGQPPQGDPVPQIPTAAIQHLITHPELWQAFEQKYGPGTARQALGVRQ